MDKILLDIYSDYFSVPLLNLAQLVLDNVKLLSSVYAVFKLECIAIQSHLNNFSISLS